MPRIICKAWIYIALKAQRSSSHGVCKFAAGITSNCGKKGSVIFCMRQKKNTETNGERDGII